MRHLRSAVNANEVEERLRRGWLARFQRGVVSKTELVWMPTYLVTIRMTSPQGEGDTICSVDACSGAFALFQMADEIDDADPPGETFPPSLDEREAEALARESLVKTILRRRGHAGKPTPRETVSVELLSYPYWVVYYQRRRGLLDIKVLDAATGQPVGNKIRIAILESFRVADRNQEGQ